MTDATMPLRGPNLRWLASNQVGLALVIAIFVLIFWFGTAGFGSRFNLYALGRVVAIDIVIGCSMMVVLATGGMNLAVGSIAVSSVMFSGWLMQVIGLPVIPSVLVALTFGAALGWVNGIAVVKTGVNSFIITLATMSLFFGAMIVLTEAEAFNALPKSFTDVGKMKVFGFVSVMVFFAIAVAAALHVLFRYSAIGRQILAAGANARAASLSGVPVNRAIVTAHMLSGGLATLAGLMLTMRNGAALPSMTGHIGMDWLLPAFLAPVLGGTLLSGGSVSVIGTLLGALLVGVLKNGLLLLQVGDFWIQLFLGLILLAAVVLDRARGVYAERRRVVRP